MLVVGFDVRCKGNIEGKLGKRETLQHVKRACIDKKYKKGDINLLQ